LRLAAGTLAVFAACIATPTLAFAADGASVTQRYDPGDGRVHTDVTVTFYSGGGASYAPYIGVGTARVTLPQAQGVTLPVFSAPAADPAPIECSNETGAYDQAGTGFVCTFEGQKHEAEFLFPTTVVLHLVSGTCYPFPDIASRQPARVDVWNARGVTDGAPDASFAIASSDPCSVPPPPPPVQNVAGVKAPAKTCTVPNLKKATLKTAGSRLTKAGCKRGTVTRVYSTKVKKGRVVSQSVKAKKKVKRGTKVKLKVSKGPRTKK
jgi:hypothetical protein